MLNLGLESSVIPPNVTKNVCASKYKSRPCLLVSEFDMTNKLKGRALGNLGQALTIFKQKLFFLCLW